ncbi:MAG: ankyrin repeat domain-containing protein [Wolbachia endosymbiont of Melophagus ovinus]|nr:ankyrin repeat domain-containing protein [Wolbachia endosymbiont of Melophagus ovinus]MDG7057126.1 ankyrin repeat domain-containing protein [Wolbachia endosymbiont of Penenirmus auritus]
MTVKLRVQAWNKSSNNAITNKNQPKLTSYVIKYKNGFSSLYAAFKRGYAKAVKRSIENKLAKVQQDKDAFFTLLRKVAARNILDVVKHLTKSGMDIEITDKDGYTPLHVVAARNSAKSIKYLLENGANLEARDKDGFTPLHCAVISNRTKGVKCLVESGANLEAQDKDGCTPLFYAKCVHNDKIIKLLQEKAESKKDLDKDALKETKSQSHTSEVSLEKAEKRQPCFLKIASINLAAMLVVLSIVSSLSVLPMIVTSAIFALITGGITYMVSKPTTELKGVAIQGLVQHGVGKV